jgi:hypothetical protein
MGGIHRTHTGKEKFTFKFGKKYKGAGDLGVGGRITSEQNSKEQDVGI